MIDLTFRKKISLLSFLFFIFRRVYFCLTHSNCEGCEYEQICNDIEMKNCALVCDLSDRIVKFLQEDED